MADSGDFTAIVIGRERSFPSRVAKISFGGCFSASLPGSSGVFENQDAAVVQIDFGCLPCLTYFFATFFAKATNGILRFH